jgi:tryptophan-rich sensory protein
VHVLSTIESSALSVWVRESSSLWAYPGLLFIHTVGVAVVVGLSTMIDLRVLGVARTLPVAPFEAFFPIIWTAFWMNTISGTILFAASATAKAASPLFALKMIAIAAAAWISVELRRAVFKDWVAPASISPRQKFLAMTSLTLWCAVIIAGRLMTYLSTVSGVPGVAR